MLSWFDLCVYRVCELWCIRHEVPRTHVYLVTSFMEAHKVGMASVPAVSADPVLLGDAYTATRDDVMGHGNGAEWLDSQLQADLIRSMSVMERRRRRLGEPTFAAAEDAEPQATADAAEPPLANSAAATSGSSAASEAPDSVWCVSLELCRCGVVGTMIML
jgi:hypothetical protein